MKQPHPTWSAGIVNHGSYADLEACLASIALQTWPPERVVVWDTGVDPAVVEVLGRRYSEVEFVRGENVGYAGGANRVLGALIASKNPDREDGTDPPDFALVLNPDIALDPDFSERLLHAVAPFENTVIATGKLLREGRERIDSAGIVYPRNRRPRDRGSEEVDLGQYDRAEIVEGASGAAMLLRVGGLPDLAIEGEVFDESFFAYHEDTDLCWRARRLGFEIRYEPSAVAVHQRGWQKDRRFAVPVPIRRHSFKNHYLQLIKNEQAAGFLSNLPWLVVWEGLRLAFVLSRDRALLQAYGEAWNLLPEAWRKRRLIRERCDERDSRRRRSD